MARMVRKQIYIEPSQETLLKKRAKERGVSEAELIREGIEWVLNAPITVPRDLRSWEKEMKFIEERRKIIVPQTGRTWTREELYDERFERYAH